jgi:probable phosphoglycerate mutase
MKNIYFVRHGQSEMNVSGHFAGAVTDTSLTEEGRNQAKAAGKQLQDEGITIDIIVSSPLSRAHETARQIASEIDYDMDGIILHEDLVERHFGILEGTLFGTGPVTPKAHSSNPYAYEEIKNAEKIADMQARADRMIKYLYSLPEENILIVSHGHFGRALRRSANKLPVTEFGETFENAKIVKLI